MPLSPPAQRRPHQRSSSPVESAYFMSTSTSSSKETAEPVTPLEADEEFIDQLWQQVRSRTSTRGSIEIAVPGEEKKVQASPAVEKEVPKPSRPARLSKQPSLTFRDSSNGKNTLAILNLPGVLKSDVHISYQYRRLIVSYKAVEETEKWEPDKVVQEVKERRCVRSIPLPENIRENPGRPLVLHTLPSNPPLDIIGSSTSSVFVADSLSHSAADPDKTNVTKGNGESRDRAISSSVLNIPRLVSVVEIIKREYFRELASGSQSTGLYQYNHLGFIEECALDPGSQDDEGQRQKHIMTVLEGKKHLKQEKMPYMKITLCTSALPALDSQTTLTDANFLQRKGRQDQLKRDSDVGVSGNPWPDLEEHTLRCGLEVPTITEPAQNPLSLGDKSTALSWPDIGHLAKWSVSSYKFGFGPECLRDDDPETFWHSDGPQPHSIIIQFPRKTAVQKVSLHLSFQLDDSYTPSTLCLRAGTSLSDLQDVRVVSFDKPNGWVAFDVSSELNEEGQEFKPVYCYVLQIIILANHMNGKDTHVRGLRILGPLEDASHEDDPFPFVSSRFKMYECIR
ncbi:hypothetical protein ACEPAI_6809 [Sanghuangporus weigelae]